MPSDHSSYQVTNEKVREKYHQLPNPIDIHSLGEFLQYLVHSTLEIKEKQFLCSKIYDIVRFSEAHESLLNIWTTAILLEHTVPSFPYKIAAAQGLIQDPLVSDEWLNRWIDYVWNYSEKIPEDLLIFLASDFRSLAEERINPRLLSRLNDFNF